MALSLDHVFILTEPGAPFADELVLNNFIEGPSNTHSGQGTANRRFFFNGFTLEWIFVTDEHEAVTGPGKKLQFVDRWKVQNASPFGIVVRTDAPLLYPHWLYWPDYFNGEMSFAVGENSSELQEPLCICMPQELPQCSPPEDLCNADKVLTKIDIYVDAEELSEAAKHFKAIEGVNLILDDAHRTELTFNHGEAGQHIDLLTSVPVRLVW